MSLSTTPHAITPPPESALAATYAGAELVDAYAIALAAGATRDITVLARAILAHPAPWVRGLMRVRDGIMGRLGVKTSARIMAENRSAPHRERIDFFPVISRSARELVVGENDRHLDFRTSVLVRAGDGAAPDMVIATTVVHCHNRLGRAYLTVIGPFHVLIVKAYLRNAARRGWPVEA